MTIYPLMALSLTALATIQTDAAAGTLDATETYLVSAAEQSFGFFNPIAQGQVFFVAIDDAWLPLFVQRFGADLTILGVWNQDGTQYGQSVDPDTGAVTGTPLYHMDQTSLLNAMPPKQVYDQSGAFVSSTPYTDITAALRDMPVVAGQAQRQP
jgi:hypothetical protein